jgi:hypothetical protein
MLEQLPMSSLEVFPIQVSRCDDECEFKFLDIFKQHSMFWFCGFNCGRSKITHFPKIFKLAYLTAFKFKRFHEHMMPHVASLKRINFCYFYNSQKENPATCFVRMSCKLKHPIQFLPHYTLRAKYYLR